MLVDAPARQNASAMPVPRPIEFGVAAGSTDPLRLAVSIQEIGKNVSKALGSPF